MMDDIPLCALGLLCGVTKVKAGLGTCTFPLIGALPRDILYWCGICDGNWGAICREGIIFSDGLKAFWTGCRLIPDIELGTITAEVFCWLVCVCGI